MKDGFHLLREIEILTQIEENHNERVRSIARKLNFPVTDDMLLDCGPDISERRVKYEDMRKAAEQLDDLEKIVFKMIVFEGGTRKNTAEMLFYSERHIARIYNRAINKISEGEENEKRKICRNDGQTR